MVNLTMNFSENNNFAEFRHKYIVNGNETQMQNVNMLFVDAEFNSLGHVLINRETTELNILHELENTTNKNSTPKTRKGATGAKNVFRLHSGNWKAFGGTLDDTFIVNGDDFQGSIHGLGGVNALILTESITAGQTIVNLLEKSLAMSGKPVINFSSIQIISGRKQMQDKVICACDTKLVMLEGGLSNANPDVIQVQENFCNPELSVVVADFTDVDNNATKGNFTYHIRADANFNIKYKPTNLTNHAFKFEIALDQIRNIKYEKSGLEISFEHERKIFPLNFHNLPTFQIAQNPELVAELILEENQPPQASIIGRSPFSRSIFGLNGVENEIGVHTSSSIQSIFGGDMNDNIFISWVESILIINGGGGTNRVQLAEELHQNRGLEVDIPGERVVFLEDSSSFVTVLRGIELFNGREHSFERVILGCDTLHVKFADEVRIRKDCGYNVRIEIGVGTRVIFEIEDEPPRETTILSELGGTDDDRESTTAEYIGDDDDEVEEEDDEIDNTSSRKELPMLEPSKFYYHFSTIQSFDIEIDSFSRLVKTRHIFYLTFTLSQLHSLRFSQNDTRLVYSTLDQNEMEYSHLMADVEETSMFYSQPEFMTGEGFLLRISRYGEIIASVANLQESVELGVVQQDMIPRLSAYASQLGISFMLETSSDFVYCGNPIELSLLTNREKVRSHLIGFNRSTYQILDLDNDVFIYPQLVGHDSVHVLDLSGIVPTIRNMTGLKYVPEVVQVGTDMEIRMTNWTGMFPGKVILKHGVSYNRNMIVILNSIAMEILPVDGDTSLQTSWVIKPRPISIPEGHAHLLAAEDLEDGVIIRGDAQSNNNTKFEYSIDKNDLIVTNIRSDEVESNRSTSFIIFDYFLPPTQNNNGKAETLQFGKVNTVDGVHVKLGKDTVNVSSNMPPISEETGKKIPVVYYEDILDVEEANILKGFPDIPRKFKVSRLRKIRRASGFLYAALGIFVMIVTLVAGRVCI